ncbi:MAG TPA: hypothetical protein VFJ82_09170 [Longimicrobium sp.]|nr:hypothetical protein [Longimicrobium sp.]
MSRLTIQQFRSTLSGAGRGGALVRAYRELARRPELAAAAHISEWAAWPSAAQTPANA